MGKQKVYLLDTNVILRFLLADHPQLSQEAKAIFEKAEAGKVKLFLNHTTIAEVFWVLESFYKLTKEEIIEIITGLLRFPNMKVPEKRMMLGVLSLLNRRNISYIDAYNLIFARKNGLELKTFDKKLERLFKSKSV